MRSLRLPGSALLLGAAAGLMVVVGAFGDWQRHPDTGGVTDGFAHDGGVTLAAGAIAVVALVLAGLTRWRLLCVGFVLAAGVVALTLGLDTMREVSNLNIGEKPEYRQGWGLFLTAAGGLLLIAIALVALAQAGEAE